jgi:hypothetical protein
VKLEGEVNKFLQSQLDPPGSSLTHIVNTDSVASRTKFWPIFVHITLSVCVAHIEMHSFSSKAHLTNCPSCMS